MAEEYAGVRACGVFRRGEEVLLIRQFNDAGVARYMTPGGGVDYGEPVEDDARREMHEEVGVVVSDMRYIGMFESIGAGADGVVVHNVSLVYEVATDADAIYRQDVVRVDDNGNPFTAVWVRVEDVPAGRWDVADGLPGMLRSMEPEPLGR